MFGEVLAEMSHGIGSNYSDVVELPRVLDTISSNLLCYKIYHLIPDLHA